MQNSVLLFDGVCNLCSGFVKFVLKHEKDHVIKFASLQSAHASELLKLYHHNDALPPSIVFIENGKALYKSAAIYKISSHLKKPWSWIQVFKFLPAFITDFFYLLIARNRYVLFGKRVKCMVPDNNFSNRFLV